MNPDDENVSVAEEAPETQPEQIEAPEQEQEEAQEQQETNLDTEEESSEPSQVTEAQQEEEVDWSQYVPQLNSQLPVDENGQVDPQQFREQMKQELRFEQQQIRSWTRLEQQHPELKSDAELRDMIVANQLYDVQRGGKGTLETAAQRVFGRVTTAKNQGKAEQQTSIKVQKSAALQKPGGSQSQTATSDVKDRIRAGDQSAIQAQLASWIDSKVI